MNLNDPISTIMTADVVTIAPEQKLLDLKHIYENKRFHHHVPVVQDGSLVGIVSLIDFMRVISGASLDDDEAVYHNTTVNEIMTTNPVTIAIDDTVNDAAKVLSKGDIRSVLVLENMSLRGIVTTADIIRGFLK
jgi:CBS domain-containing protein